MPEISEKIKFSEICQLFEKIKKSGSLQQKEKIFLSYLKHFQELQNNYRSECSDDFTFYCILRMMLPKIDSRSYGLHITTLGRIYIKILGINQNSETGKRLQYKGDSNVEIEKGDYAETIYDIMKTRSNDGFSKLTLHQIEKFLNILSKGNRQNQEIEMTKFLEITSALEQKWLIRILLKNLRLNFGEQKIFNIYHPKAHKAFQKYTDLKKVCSLVESSDVNATDIDILLTKIEPFQHVRPMLCERLKVDTVGRMMEKKNFFLETKMDGERFQMHVNNGTFKYLSRNGIDYTKNFGSNSNEGYLTPMLSKLFNSNVRNLILDGEMMVWDKSEQKYRIKGEHYDVKHLQIGGVLRPCFVVYDLLYHNDVEYLNRPHVERIDKLKSILTEHTGILQFCKRIQLDNLKGFEENFNLALENDEEGVVIKENYSIYKPGQRNNSGWFKLKPDYVNGLTTDFDLIIIGAFYNRTKSYIKSFLVGLIENATAEISNGDPKNVILHSVAKVSSGLKVQERQKICELLSSKLKSTKCPYKLGSLIPDVWLEPEKSIVLEIKATELFLSREFSTKFTLRFPRIEKIREDKNWYDCMTLREFEEYEEENSRVQKISKRSLDANDFTAPIMSKRSKTIFLNPYISNFKSDLVTKVTNAFDGITFCILNGKTKEKIDINDIKKIAVKHGGTIVENPLLDARKCIVIAIGQSIKLKNLISTKLYNIISVNWLLRCFLSDKITADSNIEPNPREIISATPEMEEKIKLKFDQYGDSFTEKIDVHELNLLLEDLKRTKIPKLSRSEICILKNELDAFNTSLSS